ncbi:hypothetical protein [Taklimakanibacter lacteus]|uniref:hypothetical protein n=1 Tax=Taklimakanibacter lacteus TaxID=2268456 RepID=UPI000E66AA17
MRRGSFLDVLRRGRASWSVAILYLLLLPVALGLLPKPEATAEFLLLRDLAGAEICTMPGSAESPGQPVQHQPDCMLCSTACPYTGSLAAPPPAEASADPYFLQFALAVQQPKTFALPASRIFTSDIQSRGPPA